MTSVYATWREAPYRPVVRRFSLMKTPKGLVLKMFVFSLQFTTFTLNKTKRVGGHSS